jgi:hypothetical protein
LHGQDHLLGLLFHFMRLWSMYFIKLILILETRKIDDQQKIIGRGTPLPRHLQNKWPTQRRATQAAVFVVHDCWKDLKLTFLWEFCHLILYSKFGVHMTWWYVCSPWVEEAKETLLAFFIFPCQLVALQFCQLAFSFIMLLVFCT